MSAAAVRTNTGAAGVSGRVTPIMLKSRVSSATATRSSGAGSSSATVVDVVDVVVDVVASGAVDVVGCSDVDDVVSVVSVVTVVPGSCAGTRGSVAGRAAAPSPSGRRVSVAIARSVTRCGKGAITPATPISSATTSWAASSLRMVRGGRNRGERGVTATIPTPYVHAIACCVG